MPGASNPRKSETNVLGVQVIAAFDYGKEKERAIIGSRLSQKRDCNYVKSQLAASVMKIEVKRSILACFTVRF